MAKWIQLIGSVVVVRKLLDMLHRAVATCVRWLKTTDSLPGTQGPRLTSFQRHLITNLIVGLTIAVVLHQAHDLRTLTELEDLAMDWVMQMYRGSRPPHRTRPIAFIDIDQETYERWGEPLITPRDKLAQLIQHAIDGRAAAIVVDIDLSRETGTGDDALKALLGDYIAAQDDAEPARPPLVLGRAMRPQGPEHQDDPQRERPSFLDSLVADAKQVHWGSVVFDLDSDGKIRRWHLWEPVCTAEGQSLARPSVQLELKALLDADEAQRAALAAALGELPVQGCKESGSVSIPHEPSHGDHPSKLLLGDEAVSLTSHAIERRILFRMPWTLKPHEHLPTVVADGRRVPILDFRPAAAITEASGSMSGDWLRDHIVIIGASYPDSRDVYNTPVGYMPGALIIANAIQSLSAQGTLRVPSLWQVIVIESFLILLMSYLFARFHSLWGSLFSGAAVILLLMPLSLWLFDTGLWVSFALPLVAVQIHQMAGQLEETLAKRKTGDPTHD